MSDPKDDAFIEGSAERNYASDRHLLLKEIQVLAGEVARLRGDTKHLNDVMVPREEHKRRRKVYTTMTIIGFLLLAIPLALFYGQQQRINADRAEFKKRSVEICEDRNLATRNLDALIKALLAPPLNSDMIEPPNPAVAEALVEFEKTLNQVDCSTLVTDRN